MKKKTINIRIEKDLYDFIMVRVRKLSAGKAYKDRMTLSKWINFRVRN